MNTSFSRRAGSSRRRPLVATAATAALTFAGLGLASMAQAGTTSPFDIDGSVPDADTIKFPDGFGKASELGPLNSNLTKLGVIHSAPLPMLGSTNPNAQVDLRNIWLDSAKDGDDDTWVYIAWERDSNKGTGVLMYEFMQDQEPVACDFDNMTDAQLIAGCNPWANRQPGDFILVWDQQGGNVSIIIRTWSDAAPGGDPWAPGDPLTLDAGYTVNGGYFDAALSADGYFGEAAVNLSQTVFAGVLSCTTIGNVVPGTVTGNSDTADYKDTVLADVSDYLTISNCGSVRVTKDTAPDEDLTGNFIFTLERSGGADMRYEGDGPEPGYSGLQLTEETRTLTEDGDSELVVDLIAGTDYTLSEVMGEDTPFDLTSITCTTEDGTTYSVFGGETDTDFPVIEGETTECLITNTLQSGTLIVTKVVTNDHGGTLTAPDFDFDVSGGIADGVAFEADASNSFEVMPGSYTVTENGLPIAGYDTSYANSENPNLDCDALYVGPNETVTCTITNDDIAPELTVIKVVTNDNGGSAVAGDFTMDVTATEPSDASFPGAAAPGTTITLDAGTYSVAEAGVAGGQVTVGGVVYGVSYSTDCSGSIGIGESKTCTVTNDDTPASPAGTTTQSWVLHDSLTITGLRAGASDAGDATATFRLWSDAQCSIQVGTDEEVDVSGTAAATTAGVSVSSPGTYYWTVEFSGDQYNNGFTTDCGDEISQILATDAVNDSYPAGVE